MIPTSATGNTIETIQIYGLEVKSHSAKVQIKPQKSNSSTLLMCIAITIINAENRDAALA